MKCVAIYPITVASDLIGVIRMQTCQNPAKEYYDLCRVHSLTDETLLTECTICYAITTKENRINHLHSHDDGS